MSDETSFMLLPKVHGPNKNRRVERGVLAGSEHGRSQDAATLGNPVWDSLRRAKQGCLKCREWDSLAGGCHLGRIAGSCDLDSIKKGG
jgi:hypothetical protein